MRYLRHWGRNKGGIMIKAGTILYSTYDEYTILKQVGQGGNGMVFLARSGDGTHYAIKAILSKISKMQTDRFKNEIEFCKKYSHKNIIKVIDSGRYVNEKIDIIFCVMPYYEDTLRSKINKGLSPQEAIEIFVNILSGLDYAHKNNTIHRDIKPENILFRKSSNESVIADFGIAHFASEDLIAAVETKRSDRLANFKYAAPEQKSHDQVIDGRADVYACGLILNEMFTKQVAQGGRFIKIADVNTEYGYLDTVFDSLFCQNPNDRLYPIEKIIIELKVLSEKQQNENELQELLNRKISEINPNEDIPVPIVTDIDYSNNILKFELSYKVSNKWTQLLREGNYSHSSVMRYDPNSFTQHGKSFTVNINNANEQAIGNLVRHFKEWLTIVTIIYNEQQKYEFASRKRAEEEAMKKEINEKEKEIRMNDYIRKLL